MLKFTEWLVERMSRLGAMIPEEIPDTAPEPGQIVVLMDKNKTSITNDDIYYVLSRNDDDIILALKTAIDKVRPNLGEQVKIHRSMWKDFTIVNHLLTRKERIERFSSKPVWMIGASKNKWISNRETELKRKSKGQVQSEIPKEFNPAKLAQIKQQLTAGVEEEPEVTAARNWLKGA